MSVKTFRGFGGGITDFYIGARPDQFEKADNLRPDQYLNLINRPGSELDYTSSYNRARVPVTNGTRRIGLMARQSVGVNANPTILKQVASKLYYDNGTAMVELQGPASTAAFNVTTDQVPFSYTEWNDHTIITHSEPFQKPLKIYRDDLGVLNLRTAGLPRLADTFTATGGTGANYIYALVLKYTYKVGDVEYINRGRPVLKEFTNIGTATSGDSPGITVGSIPSLVNAAGEHYDVAGIDVEVYRTRNNGTTLYLAKTIDNGDTSVADDVSDDALVNNLPLYTSGGEVANDRPPKCRFVHATSDFCYYAHSVEVGVTSADSDYLPQRFYQSKRGGFDSVPGSFFSDIEEPITAFSSVRSIPVVFGSRSVSRIDGNIDNFGRGALLPRKIDDAVGCIGQLSVVQTSDGLFFAGNDGFYFTDGYKLQKLSEEFQDTYMKIIADPLKKARVSGAHELAERQVVWAVTWSENNEGDDNKRLFVLDLDTMSFTTYSSGYDGRLPVLQSSGNISGAVISGIADTTGVLEGMPVVIEDASVDLYVESVDSTSQITLSGSAPTGTGVSFTVLANTPEAQFFKQFEPTSLLYTDNKLWIASRTGFTKFLNYDIATDPRLDGSLSGSDAVAFETLPIIWDYRGPADALGTTEFRKWVNGIIVKARPRFDLTSDVTIQPFGENDDSGFPHKMEYILFQPFWPWGTPAIPYGDPALYQKRATIIDVKRRFPAGKMRCEYKQVQFRTAFVKKYESLSRGEAIIGGTGGVKTLTNNIRIWPEDVKDYWVRFEIDGYVKQYRILSRDSNTQLSIADPADDLVAGVTEWAIYAYLRSNLIQLIEYSVFHEVLGASQQPYGGENKVNS